MMGGGSPGEKMAVDLTECTGCAGGSYVEVWVYPGRIDIFERQGDGSTRKLVEALRKAGLEIHKRNMSFCG